MKEKFRFTGQEKSWILYDWANSVYATIMMAAIFSAYFTALAKDAPMGGDYWWSLGTTIAMLAMAIIAPIVGAFADYKGYKRRLFTVFLILGVISVLLCSFSNDWRFLLAAYVLSNIGFNGSIILYDSSLPDVTTPDRMDKVSSWGYAMGYIGGSTIPFVISIVMITFRDKLWSTVEEGLRMSMAVKYSVLMTAVWWALFTIPYLRNVKQNSYVEKPEKGIAKATFGGILQTAKKIIGNKSVFLFVIAYFFYIDGVGTIITLATSYGTNLGLDMTGMIIALLVTQLVAVPFSILFGKLAKLVGSLNVLSAAVAMYMVICVVGFFMGLTIENAEIPAKQQALSLSSIAIEEEVSPDSTNLTDINRAIQEKGILDEVWNSGTDYLAARSHAQILFWVLAVMVGMVQGGIQALSRSYFGKLVPPENAGEFFGFFEIFGKFAAIMGPLLYVVTKGLTGRSSFSILAVILLFVVAFCILVGGRKTLLSNPMAR